MDLALPASAPPPSKRTRAVAISRKARSAAGGRGPLAEAILAVAAEKGVTIQRDADLAEVLSALGPEGASSDAATALTAALLDRLYRLNDERK